MTEKRIKKWYEICDEYEYHYNAGDKVKFELEPGKIIHGIINSVGSLAQWKVVEEKTGWWIFGKKNVQYGFIQPSYIIRSGNGDYWTVEESDLKIDE